MISIKIFTAKMGNKVLLHCSNCLTKYFPIYYTPPYTNCSLIIIIMGVATTTIIISAIAMATVNSLHYILFIIMMEYIMSYCSSCSSAGRLPYFVGEEDTEIILF